MPYISASCGLTGKSTHVSVSTTLSVLCASVGRTLEFFSEEGDSYTAPLPLPSEAQVFAWSPTEALLVAGLQSGHIALVQAPPHATPGSPPRVTLDATAHGSTITLAKFSPSGTRLLTGDAQGTVVIWRVEEGSGSITPLQTYKRGGGAVEGVFLTPPQGALEGGGAAAAAAAAVGGGSPPPGAGAAATNTWVPLATLPCFASATAGPPGGGEAAGAGTGGPPSSSLIPTPPSPTHLLPTSTGFLWASDTGALAYGDDAGRSLDITPPLGQPIDILEYTPGGALPSGWGLIVVVTRGMIMLQFGVEGGGSGRVYAGPRAKLGVKVGLGGVGGGMRQRAWAGSRVLTTTTPEENFVRAWVMGGGSSSSSSSSSIPLPSTTAITTTTSGTSSSSTTSASGASSSSSNANPTTSSPSSSSSSSSSPALLTSLETTSYSISSTSSGLPIRRGDRMQAMAFSPTTCILAAGTDSGQVYLWRLCGDPGAWGVGAGAWEPVGGVGAGGGIEELVWGGVGGGVLAVRTASGGAFAVTAAPILSKLLPLPRSLSTGTAAGSGFGPGGGELAVALTSPRTVLLERRWRGGRHFMSATFGGGEGGGGAGGGKGRFKGADASLTHLVTFSSNGEVVVWPIVDEKTFKALGEEELGRLGSAAAAAAAASAPGGDDEDSPSSSSSSSVTAGRGVGGKAGVRWDGYTLTLTPSQTFTPPGGVSGLAVAGGLVFILPSLAATTATSSSSSSSSVTSTAATAPSTPHIAVFSLDGTPHSTLPLGTGLPEDVPMCVDARGRFVAVASRGGSIGVWCVEEGGGGGVPGGPSLTVRSLGCGTFNPPPRLLLLNNTAANSSSRAEGGSSSGGGGGREPPCEISSLKVNADGSKVMVLARRSIPSGAASGAAAAGTSSGRGGKSGKAAKGKFDTGLMEDGSSPASSSLGGEGGFNGGTSGLLPIGASLLASLSSSSSSSPSSSLLASSLSSTSATTSTTSVTSTTVRVPDTRVYTYDVERDTTAWFELGPGRFPSSGVWECEDPGMLCVQSERSKSGGGGGGDKGGAKVGGDDTTTSSAAGAGAGAGTGASGTSTLLDVSEPDVEAVTLFTTPPGVTASLSAGGGAGGGPGGGEGLVRSDALPLPPPNDGLVGLRLPYLVTLVPPLVGGQLASSGAAAVAATLRAGLGLPSPPSSSSSSSKSLPPSTTAPSSLTRFPPTTLRDFTGCEASVETQDATRAALTDFARHCAAGSMEAAYTAIRALPNLGAIWENMAHGAVNGRRLDVAQVALGQMGHARGAKALREAGEREAAAAAATASAGPGAAAATASTSTTTTSASASASAPLPPPPASPTQLALLSLHLGRSVAEAGRLYREAGRPDLLNRTYREAGAWGHALACAAREDRVHLAATHAAHARALEAGGEVGGALQALRCADTDAGRLEGCRMLVEARDFAWLEEWVEECLAGGGGGKAGGGGEGKGGEEEEGEGGKVAAAAAAAAAATAAAAVTTAATAPNVVGRWYAQFLEAQGDGGGAEIFYERVGDAPALVRMFVARGDIAGAMAVATEATGGGPGGSSSAAGGGGSGSNAGSGAATAASKKAAPQPTASSSSSSSSSNPTSTSSGGSTPPTVFTHPRSGKTWFGGPASAYLLARHMESVGDVNGAIAWYELAGRYNHAVRLTAAAGREGELLALASRAGPATQLAVARSLEASAGSPSSSSSASASSGSSSTSGGGGGVVAASRAARLYHSGGATPRAMELCLAWGLWEELGGIAGDLAGNPEAAAHISPALLTRTAEALTGRRAFAGAVGLLVAGKRWAEALDMALANGVALTEALGEALTPPKPRLPPGNWGEVAAAAAAAAAAGENGAAPPQSAEAAAAAADPTFAAALGARVNHLLRLAGALKKQGLYHLACKKYTQAGDKVKAMKALLKSGDVEKISFFAGVCRSREIYVLAANYLQTLAWHTDAELLRSILEFYTKAKAYEQLSGFYEACSAAEIDEFRNYEKAAAALREASKVAMKIKEEALKDARVAALSTRIALVERFVLARKLAKSDTAQMVAVCVQLLEQRDAETAIRVGDVYALLVYFHAQQKDWTKAHGFLEGMIARAIPLEPYIDTPLVQNIYGQCGLPPPAPTGAGGGGG